MFFSTSKSDNHFLRDLSFLEWILVTAELTPFIFGLVIAYWGDRIHRASWIGALTLLQSVSYFILIIPHLTHRVRVIEQAENVTHMSLYAGQCLKRNRK